MSMHVVKRDGRTESVHFDKITSRISKLAFGLDTKVRLNSRFELPFHAASLAIRRDHLNWSQ